MGKYSKKSESTGIQSVIDAEREYKKYQQILKTVMDPDEFKEIWKVVTAGAKLNFILNSMKYVFKEKGKETEIEASSVEESMRKLTETQETIQKLLEE
jgi:hypothetical protein